MDRKTVANFEILPSRALDLALSHMGPVANDGLRTTPIRDRAKQAEKFSDWLEAASCWSDARAIDPMDREAFLGHLIALTKLGQSTVAMAQLQHAPADFKGHLDFSLFDATLAQIEGQLDVARRRWEDIGNRFEHDSYAVRAAVNSLLLLNQGVSAERLIGRAIEVSPHSAELLRLAAQTAVACGNWETASERLKRCHAVQPRIENSAFETRTLWWSIAQGRLSLESERLKARARDAQQQNDWLSAIEAWMDCVVRKPDDREALIGLGYGFRGVEDLESADKVFHDAVLLYPNDVQILVEYAQIAAARSDHQESASRWRQLLRDGADACMFTGMAAIGLLKAGARAESKALLDKAMEASSDDLSLLIPKAVVAEACEDWPEAVRCWKAAVRIRPDDAALKEFLGKASWHKTLSDSSSAASPEFDSGHFRESRQSLPEVSDVVCLFENLCDNCELGLVQRHFGAEPVSLYRFSSLTPEKMIELLDVQFAPIGDPKHIVIKEESNEYIVEDDRGYFWMHTLVNSGSMPPEKILKQQISRITLLRRKLLSMLRDGSKILVCKDSRGILSDATLYELSASLRSYGPNIVLGIRLADADNERGTVLKPADDIFIGHIGSMFGNGSVEIDYDGWRQVLETVYAQVFSTQNNEPDNKLGAEHPAHC